MTAPEALMLCPSCGGKAEESLHARRGWIGCMSCDLGVAYNAPYREDALAVWNRRVNATWKPTGEHPDTQRVVVVRWTDTGEMDLAYYGQEDDSDPYAWRQSVSNCLYVDGHEPHTWIDYEALARFHLARAAAPSSPDGISEGPAG